LFDSPASFVRALSFILFYLTSAPIAVLAGKFLYIYQLNKAPESARGREGRRSSKAYWPDQL